MVTKKEQQAIEFEQLKNIWDNWSDWVFRILSNPDPKDRIRSYDDFITDLAVRFDVHEDKMRLLIFKAASHHKLGGGEPLSSFIAKLNMEMEILENRKGGK